MAMKVNVSTLKNHLSAVLKKVKVGEQVIVVDRNQPIAKLSAISPSTLFEESESLLDELQRKGIISLAKKKKRSLSWLESHLIKGKKYSAVEALLKEREESR